MRGKTPCQAHEPASRRARPTRCDSGADGIVRMEETEGLSMNNAIDTRKIALAALFTAASLILSGAIPGPTV